MTKETKSADTRTANTTEETRGSVAPLGWDKISGIEGTSAEAPKHTPGPWQICPGGGFLHFTAVNGEIVAKINANKITYQDARLIAAAPELLAALKICVDRLEITDQDPLIGLEAKALAWSAIAKSEGRA
jgi:hypothetical protein